MTELPVNRSINFSFVLASSTRESW